jgi:O-antigen/teichoic acid export membrane protein
LVIAALVQTFLLGVISYFLARHPLKFTFEWKYYKELYSFGSKVSFISILEYISSTLDTFVIGRFLGSGLLGIYNRAFMLINLPYQYFTSSISRVLFPAFSRVQNDNEKVKKNLLDILTIVSFILLPLALLISILSKEIVLIILGEKWVEAIPLVGVLAFAATFNFIAHFIANVFEAKGILKPKMFLQLLYILLLITGFSLFLDKGLFYLAIVVLAARLLYFIFYIGLSKYYLKITLKEMMWILVPALYGLISAVFIIAVYKFIVGQNINIYFNFAAILIIYLITQFLLFRSNLFAKMRELLIVKIDTNSKIVGLLLGRS